MVSLSKTFATLANFSSSWAQRYGCCIGYRNLLSLLVGNRNKVNIIKIHRLYNNKQEPQEGQKTRLE